MTTLLTEERIAAAVETMVAPFELDLNEEWERLDREGEVDTSARVHWVRGEMDIKRSEMKAALRAALPEIEAALAERAFKAGFWAWLGPANEREHETYTKWCEHAWQEYGASALGSGDGGRDG